MSSNRLPAGPERKQIQRASTDSRLFARVKEAEEERAFARLLANGDPIESELKQLKKQVTKKEFERRKQELATHLAGQKNQNDEDISSCTDDLASRSKP